MPQDEMAAPRPDVRPALTLEHADELPWLTAGSRVGRGGRLRRLGAGPAGRALDELDRPLPKPQREHVKITA
ncbi:MAG: hypothetical protein M3401_15190 [Actinomycetota bacterium]|nr:hypothetical protein [Actinomycetota bacterium]